jgi:K+-transporting ATPase c subunit
MTIVLGVAYPLAVTAFAQVSVEDRADGQLVEVDGEVIGSRLLAQEFTGDEYFHPRPSAAGTTPRRAAVRTSIRRTRSYSTPLPGVSPTTGRSTVCPMSPGFRSTP